jgi:hypothetical protein
MLSGTKRKAKPDDITPEKRAKPMVLSTASKALTSRFSPIDDGSEDNEEEDDVSEAIEDHLIPISVVISDPDPKRLMFATINKDGDLKGTIFAIDKHLRPFVPTSSHEQFYKTGQSAICTTEGIT